MNRQKLINWGLLLLPVGMILYALVTFSIHTPIWMDEYYFYRLSQELPEYGTSVDWIYEDKPELLIPSSTLEGRTREYYSAIYDTPIYTHTPLPTILVWPLVELTDNLAEKGIISGLEIDNLGGDLTDASTFAVSDQTKILRMVPILLTISSLLLIYFMLKRRLGIYALLAFLPVILLPSVLLMGALWFYWDAFMVLFFLLTLYLLDKNPKSKWAYLTSCCMVNTKMFIGVLFLVPLVLKNKKIALAVFSLVPFYFVTLYVTGDPFFWVTHYLGQTAIHQGSYTEWVLPQIWALVVNWRLLTILLLSIGCIFFIKEYSAYVAFYLLSWVYGFGFGLSMCQVSTILYGSGLVCPLVASKVFPLMWKKKEGGFKSELSVD